eukprot:m.23752 g.23752  ORF g.23752 m.23752 type:complete len:80 (-) comp9023_c0_seq2:3732-3971(-)
MSTITQQGVIILIIIIQIVSTAPLVGFNFILLLHCFHFPPKFQSFSKLQSNVSQVVRTGHKVSEDFIVNGSIDQLRVDI